jgi:hypothetical protein
MDEHFALGIGEGNPVLLNAGLVGIDERYWLFEANRG